MRGRQVTASLDNQKVSLLFPGQGNLENKDEIAINCFSKYRFGG